MLIKIIFFGVIPILISVPVLAIADLTLRTPDPTFFKTRNPDCPTILDLPEKKINPEIQEKLASKTDAKSETDRQYLAPKMSWTTCADTNKKVS
jgi:hypothetical protein